MRIGALRVNPIDSLQWLATTVRMEAGGEPYAGKLAVSFAICNRARARGLSVSDVVLQAWQFSAWNTDAPTRMRLDDIRAGDDDWLDCAEAAAAALWEAVSDPIQGRTLYLNEPAVLAASGRLPNWWIRAGATDPGVVIGRHTFRRDP